MALSAVLVALTACMFAASVSGQREAAWAMASTYTGDGTYYGAQYRRGFGHCSYHFGDLGTLQGYAGTPLAINDAQGAGGNPIQGSWKQGFICDECPECKHGDLDQQVNGDGRWTIEWFPTQCPVGSSTFKFAYQGGNPWYRKLQVGGGRVPVVSVQLLEGGSWKQLISTIDNYHEYHGDVSKVWGPCATAKLTSVLGDTVTDSICCSDGTCSGTAQFPCRPEFPGCSVDDTEAQRQPLKKAAKAVKAAVAKATASVKKSG